MKRLVALVLLLVLLCSCGSEYDILEYQKGDISAVCEVNGEYKINIIKKEEKRALEIITPSELDDVQFEYDGKSWCAISGEVKIPMEKEQLSGICALCSIFDLEESSITTVSDTLDGYSTVNFEGDDASYSVTYNKQALPSHIRITSADFEFDIEIIAIEIK